MGRLWTIGIALCVTFALSGAALAQANLTGLYTGTGEGAGTTMRLFSNGELLAGDFSGRLTGAIAGKSDADSAAAFVFSPGTNTRDVTLTILWEGDTFTVNVAQPARSDQLTFQRVQDGAPVAPEPPGLFFVIGGAQAGPLSPDEIMARINAGEITADTLSWTPGQSEWREASSNKIVAEVLPPAVPTMLGYFVVENGAQAGPFSPEDIVGRIKSGATKRGDLVWNEAIVDWTPIEQLQEFAQYLAPAIPQPPPVPVAGAESFEAVMTGLLAQSFPTANPDQLSKIAECYLGVMAVMTPTEQAMITDGNPDLSGPDLDSIEKAHPGFSANLQLCSRKATDVMEHQALITRPATPPAPPPVGGVMPEPVDAFAAMIYEFFSQEGVRTGFKVRAAQDCVIALLTAELTPQERQVLIDMKFDLQGEAQRDFDKNHPRLFEKMDACEAKS